ncbi:hypothetical protein DVR12_22840 [Chitinophaga silvatica]|uniref:Uncharacterized protein n=1 Tax=Chitinophaga silvatica TaxID=2282649 RepID=A0A3E1Y458_9BACT|nr:hypothetical protein [Chitinophaga silvatica]RFS19474.1 hypothetical protein DVR12_22840 [Chitinophaga silvatica]
MPKYTDKYLTPQQVDDFLKSKEIDSTYHDLFRERLENFFMEVELEGDDSYSKDEWGNSALKYGHAYVTAYDKLLKAGHGILWASAYAHQAWLRDEENSFREAWDTVYDEDEQLAREELDIYCRGLNLNEHYKQRFILAVTEDFYNLRKALEVAATWSSTYQKLINTGKTEFYAKLYADTAEVFSPVYTEKYVNTYQAELDNGRDDNYAEVKASYAADMYDTRDRFGAKLSEEKRDEIETAIKGYIDGWDYARNHGLKQGFVEWYQNTYMERWMIPELSKLKGEELTQKIVEISLKRYNEAIEKEQKRGYK